jgi:hypothetical protein
VKTNAKNVVSNHAREQRLLEQLRRQPELLERLETIVGLTQADGEKLPTADEVEERLVEEVRRLGQRVMTDWAGNAEARVGREVKQEQPKAGVRKKKT